MIVIVDCGSTKAEWAFLDDGKIVEKHTTNGFNPNFCELELLSSIALDNTHNCIDSECIKKLYFYGTGCGNETNIIKVRSVLESVFINAEIFVHSDILGSCHAIFGRQSGIACILGTGSNACLYDGNNIVKRAISLGYVLGDEGSGCHIGKKIVHDYFYGLMPNDLRVIFEETYNLTRENLIEKVYKSPQPSRFLASFAKFSKENIDNQYITKLIKESFNEFIDYHVLPLSSHETKIGFVGSVALHFQDILFQCLKEKNLQLGEIIQHPIDGLTRYYSVNQ